MPGGAADAALLAQPSDGIQPQSPQTVRDMSTRQRDMLETILLRLCDGIAGSEVLAPLFQSADVQKLLTGGPQGRMIRRGASQGPPPAL